MLGRISVNQIPDNTCIKVYNPEKQELIAIYDTFKRTGNMLGLTAGMVQQHCARKTRVYSPILEMDVAVRLSTIKPEDIEKIKTFTK